MSGQSFGLKFRRSVVGLTLLVGAALPLQAGAALALVPPAAPTENAVLVNNINLSFLVPPSIDPSGVVYLSDRDTLLIADSEVDEETGNASCIPPVPPVSVGVNMFELTRTGTLVATGLSPEVGMDGLPTLPNNKEPSGLAYNPANKHVFISNDNQDRVYEISAGVDGIYGTPDDSMSWFSTNVPGVFNASDPEDVAFDPVSGDLFIAGGIGSVSRDVFRIHAGLNGIFDGLPINGGDDTISSFPTAGYGLADLEGIGYRASSDTLLVVDSGSNESVNEFTKDGFLLRRIDIGAAQMPPTGFVPSDVDIAPASDDSGLMNMYIVDRGTDNGNTADCVSPPMDGRLYEMSTPFNNLAPFVDAGTDQSVTLGAGATLDGFVVDDGQPTPGAVTATWSKVSGPGTVTFANANDPDTTVTFGAAGTYVLALTGDDGPNETTDSVQVTVDTDPVVNQAPVVSAGTDQAVTLGTPAALDGTITDDGLPNPPAATTATWTVVSGPGAVTFADASNVDTSAAFGSVGTYVLQLAGNDSLLETTDTVQVTVNTPGGGGGGGGGGGVPPPAGGLTCTDDSFPTSVTLFGDLAGLSEEAVHAIDCLAAYGISTGTGPETFSPFDDVPRWQMALFLTRQAKVQGMGLPTAAALPFTDLEGLDQYIQTAISQLAQLGITNGTSATTFSPDEMVPRWQMAIFLVRLLTEVGVVMPAASDHGFTDIAGLDPLAQASINQLAQLAIAQGTGPTTFDPMSSVDRWQMALFLYRSLVIGGTP